MEEEWVAQRMNSIMLLVALLFNSFSTCCPQDQPQLPRDKLERGVEEGDGMYSLLDFHHDVHHIFHPGNLPEVDILHLLLVVHPVLVASPQCRSYPSGAVHPDHLDILPDCPCTIPVLHLDIHYDSLHPVAFPGHLCTLLDHDNDLEDYSYDGAVEIDLP